MSAVAPVRAVAARAGAPWQTPAARPPATPAASPRQHAGRPRLQVVPAAAGARGRVAFVVLVGGILATGLVTLLMLHTMAAQDAFSLHALQHRAAVLGEQEQQLAVANQQAQAPSALATRARSLGLVPATTLRLVRHRNGTVVAVTTGMAPVVPAVAPAPTPKPVTSPAAAGKNTPTKKSTKTATHTQANKRPAAHSTRQVKTKPRPTVQSTKSSHG